MIWVVLTCARFGSPSSAARSILDSRATCFFDSVQSYRADGYTHAGRPQEQQSIRLCADPQDHGGFSFIAVIFNPTMPALRDLSGARFSFLRSRTSAIPLSHTHL